MSDYFQSEKDDDLLIFKSIIYDGDINVFKNYLLSRSSEEYIEYTHTYGFTPLVLASKRGNILHVRALLEAGANPNYGGARNYDTPLCAASYVYHSDIVKLLLKAGADVNLGNSAGQTPLISSIIGGRTNIVKLLLKAGADMTIVTKFNHDALYYARDRNMHKIIYILENHQRASEVVRVVLNNTTLCVDLCEVCASYLRK